MACFDLRGIKEKAEEEVTACMIIISRKKSVLYSVKLIAGL